MDIVTIILPLLLLFFTLNSIFFSLIIKKVTLKDWFFFHACSPANIVYLLGFMSFYLTNKVLFLYTGAFSMLPYGSLSLFFQPWKGTLLAPQIEHLVITLNLGWIAYYTYRHATYTSATKLLIFAPYIRFREPYIHTHEHTFMQKIQDNKI